MGQVKLTLKEPLQEGKLAELVFRDRMVAGDLKGIKLSSLSDMATDDVLKIAGRLCGQVDATMSALGLFDTMEVTQLVGGFLATGLGIGTKP